MNNPHKIDPGHALAFDPRLPESIARESAQISLVALVPYRRHDSSRTILPSP